MKIYLTDVKEIRNLDADEDYVCMWDESVCYDTDTDAYQMTKEQFEWWEAAIAQKEHCEEMETEIGDEETCKFLFDQCDEYDLEMQLDKYERLLTEELKERK